MRRHPSARPVSGVLIVRPDAPLFYANAKPLRDAVRRLMRSAAPVRTLVLDLDGTAELDVTSAEALLAVAAELRARHVRLGLAHLHAAAADVLRRAGESPEDAGWQAFPSLDAAVRWATGDAAQGTFPAQPRS